MIGDDVSEQAQRVIKMASAKNLRISTAESCTGGLVAASLTAIAGSSSVVDRGFVTYSNEAKTELLGVSLTLLKVHGAVSEAVALEMAIGALHHSKADVAISITGIAGPSGATPTKPVGLVHFGMATRKFTKPNVVFFGDIGRTEVRMKATAYALELLELVIGDL